MIPVTVKQLTLSDCARAQELFTVMAQVFEERCEPLGESYLEQLLRRDEFWVLAAFLNQEIVGGVTAHVLPMTRAEYSELFIYDIAVRKDCQRQGVGRQLMTAICEKARDFRIPLVFVTTDQDDEQALAFYRSLQGQLSSVALFAFSLQRNRRSSPKAQKKA